MFSLSNSLLAPPQSPPYIPQHTNYTLSLIQSNGYTYPSSTISLPPFRRLPKPKAKTNGTETDDGKQEEEYKIVTAVRSRYNEIVILDTAKTRMLLLDSTHNVHSMYNMENKWTGSYWDEFASLPAIVPQGPIAILGLGGGTCARLMLDLWPSLRLEGWELDEILIDKAREYLGLDVLEKSTQHGGILRVHIGDALSASSIVPGGFSGIVVDLFSGGKVLPQLQEVTTWVELSSRLMDHGRIMVNCGGANSDALDGGDQIRQLKLSANDSLWMRNSTIDSLCKAFPGNLSWKKVGGEGDNYLALTGPLPDLDMWSASVPGKLSLDVKQWRECEPSI